MNTKQIRILAVYSVCLVLVCLLGGSVLAGALMVRNYLLAIVSAAMLLIALGALSYAFLAQLQRWEQEERVRKYMRSTLATLPHPSHDAPPHKTYA